MYSIINMLVSLFFFILLKSNYHQNTSVSLSFLLIVLHFLLNFGHTCLVTTSSVASWWWWSDAGYVLCQIF